MSDRLSGSDRHVMENRIHLAPGLHIAGQGRSLEIRDPAGGAVVARLDIGEGSDIAIEGGEHYPEFGRTERIQVVRLRSQGVLPLQQNYTITRD